MIFKIIFSRIIISLVKNNKIMLFPLQVSILQTSNWEGDPPGELTVPQIDIGKQVEYIRMLEKFLCNKNNIFYYFRSIT